MAGLPDEGHALSGLGERIQRLRRARGLRQRELAARSGIDEVHLVGVENGTSAPSLDVLTQVAAALDVALAELFTDRIPGPAAVVLRGDEVPTTDVDGMSVQVLTARTVVPGLHAARYRVPPNSEGVTPVRHEGTDWLYVLSGVLHIEFDQDSTTLQRGDSVSFSAKLGHRLSAVGDEAAEFLAVGTTLPGDVEAAPSGPE